MTTQAAMPHKTEQGVFVRSDNQSIFYKPLIGGKPGKFDKRLGCRNVGVPDLNDGAVYTFVFSEKQWQRLPEDLKAVLKKASLEGRKTMLDTRRAQEAKVLDDIRAAGVTIVRPDLKPFVESGKKTWAESEARLGKELMGKITAAVGN